MGLENLKSAFNNINIDVDTREASSRFESEISPGQSFHGNSALDFNVVAPSVNYQDWPIPNGWTYMSPKPFPAGFTLNFQQPGYSFGEGNLGNSKLIDITTQNYSQLSLGPLNTTEMFNRPNPGISVANHYYEDEHYEGQSPFIPGVRISPVNVLLDSINFSKYSSNTSDAPLPTFTNLSYNNTAYDPRMSTMTDFNFGQNNITINSQNPYLGSIFDYDSTPRPETPYSRVTPPPSAFPYEIDDNGNQTSNLATLYNKNISIGPATSEPNSFGWFTHNRDFSANRPVDDEGNLAQLYSVDNPPQSKFFTNQLSEQGSPILKTTTEAGSGTSQQFKYLYNSEPGSTTITDNYSPLRKIAEKFNVNTEMSDGGEFNYTGMRGNEPYRWSPIGDKKSGRYFPAERSFEDIERVGKFLASKAGINFFLKQNFLALNSKVIFDNKELSMPPTGVHYARKLRAKPQRFPSIMKNAQPALPGGFHFPGNPLGSLLRIGGGGIPNVGLFGYLLDRDDPIISEGYESIMKTPIVAVNNGAAGLAASFVPNTIVPSNGAGYSIEDTFRPGSLLNALGLLDIAAQSTMFLGSYSVKQKPVLGDFMTTQLAGYVEDYTRTRIQGGKDTSIPTGTGKTLSDAFGTETAKNIEAEKHGMPFYFKDLRDDTYIIFRAYLSSINENVSPEWTSENYIGRSEPVYIYSGAERDISFNLLLAAQTPDELRSIYLKLNRLTSLCYPEYKEDELFGETDPNLFDPSTGLLGAFKKGSGKIRMKPPLTKFRLGELFGKENNEMTGFIKSLSYTVPDNSPWETTQGIRVPKYVEAAVSYQVIHQEVPGIKVEENTVPNLLVGFTETKIPEFYGGAYFHSKTT